MALKVKALRRKLVGGLRHISSNKTFFNFVKNVILITKIASKDTNVGARLFFLTLARSYLTGRAVAFQKVDVTFLEFCPLELHLHGRAFLSIFFLTRAQFI